MSNRVELLLSEIRANIEQRRKNGEYPVGYEEGFEKDHLNLLDIDTSATQRWEDHLQKLRALQTAVVTLSEIETDRSKNRIIRIVREIAMSRHQLRRMQKELQAINLLLVEVITDLLEDLIDVKNSQQNVFAHQSEAISSRMASIDELAVQMRALQRHVDDLLRNK